MRVVLTVSCQNGMIKNRQNLKRRMNRPAFLLHIILRGCLTAPLSVHTKESEQLLKTAKEKYAFSERACIQMSYFQNLNKDELKRILKFGITGVGNTLVDYAVFSVLAALLGMNVYFAQFCGYSAGMLNSYLINRSWTFQTKRRFFSMELVRFIVVNLITLLLSMLLLKVFIDVMGMSTLLAKLPTVAFTIVVNFVLSRLWVFK